MLDYKILKGYYETLGVSIEDSKEIKWICQQIEQHSHNRALSKTDLKQINQAISNIQMERQRLLNRARDQVLQYLYDVCDWTLPLKQEERYKDSALEWMREIQAFNGNASTLLREYLLQRQLFMKKPYHSLSWLLAVLYVEVAPLPLSYWLAVLCHTDPIEFFEGQFTLKVPHVTPIAAFANKTQPSFTRLPLPLFPYRLLKQHLIQQKQSLTIDTLRKELDNMFSVKPYELSSRSAANWQRTFQSLWHHHYQVPVELLRDISDPQRHVAMLTAPQINNLSTEIKNNIYQAIIFPAAENIAGITSNSNKQHWPHKELIKYHKRKNKASSAPPSVPIWDQDNVVPKLLYHFCESLFNEGGIKRDKLPANTIDRYSNFYNDLPPLSYQAASSPDELITWVQLTFTKLNPKESQAARFYQFLRSVSQQPLTDHLDLGQFEKPDSPIRVDPFRLSVSQLHQVIEHLLSSNNGHALQRLFASVAALLGFYGALRRGEVLRLRVCDIRQVNPHKNRFQLTITGTLEGKTKNRKTRHLYVVMPDVAAKLVRIVIKMHAKSELSQPLLALCGESMASRASHYLYPVTKVLKGMFGQHVRFHHLRHSGIELTYLQGLHLAYERDNDHIAALLNDKAMEAMLSKQNCLARFGFWLEERDFSEVNDSLLFDVFSDQFGHTHYATTRRHYLHGLERIIPLFNPLKRHYSRDELRYIFELNIGSNDISRVLAELIPEYAKLPAQEKKSYQPFLSEAQLLKKIFKKPGVIKDNNHRIIKQQWNEKAWQELWLKHVPETWHCKEAFYLMNKNTMNMLNNGRVTISSLSQVWHHLGQHQGLILDKKDLNAIKSLGIPTIVASPAIEDAAPPNKSSMLNMVFNCPCNKQTLMAYQSLCHQGKFKSYQATLTLVQNRKSLKSKKRSLVEKSFARKQDTVEHQPISNGDTVLRIILHIPFSAAIFQQPLTDYFAELSTLSL